MSFNLTTSSTLLVMCEEFLMVVKPGSMIYNGKDPL